MMPQVSSLFNHASPTIFIFRRIALAEFLHFLLF